MKRIICLLLAMLLCLLALPACVLEEGTGAATTEQSTAEESTVPPELSELQQRMENWRSILLGEYGFDKSVTELRAKTPERWYMAEAPGLSDGLEMIARKAGNVFVNVPYESDEDVYIFRGWGNHAVILAVGYYDGNESVAALYHFGEEVEYVRDADFYLCDVDGDMLDEIVVWGGTGRNGVGGSEIYILKFDGESFTRLPLDELDNGFICEPLDGFRMKISNIHTGYQKTFDFSKYREPYSDEPYYWDKEGKPIETAELDSCGMDSFITFEVKDVDGDGVYEFVVSQFASLDYKDYIGDAIETWKYNAKSKKFEVVSADFVLDHDIDTEYSRNIRGLSDLKNPEQIKNTKYYQLYFEAPYRYVYIFRDATGKKVFERGTFGREPWMRVQADGMLRVEECVPHYEYDSYVYYDIKNARVSRPMIDVSFQQDEWAICNVGHEGDQYAYVLQNLFAPGEYSDIFMLA